MCVGQPVVEVEDHDGGDAAPGHHEHDAVEEGPWHKEHACSSSVATWGLVRGAMLFRQTVFRV